ncbi:MAG: MBL fold metallo-hydrolase [candidate division Zixibacteria bacterium]|nr:MBL fold metallo-hydrolase [candidate division Zixibacteria bacterium]
MSKITFFGAVGTVTGSRHLLEINDKKLLVDCGMFQGKKENRLRNWEPFPVPPDQIDDVLLTHAHIDHSGYLPGLCSEGFDGKIHCTHSTHDLCKIMLADSAHIQEEDAKYANKKGFSKHSPAEPLYTVEDAKLSLSKFHSYNYGEDFKLMDGYRIKFKDAGHILGSGFVDIKSLNSNKKIFFSGDIGSPRSFFLREPTQAFNVDYLIIESTYGDRLHADSSPKKDLARIIKESMKRGGLLIIPAFAVGRTQTLLFLIRQLEEERQIPVLPVYVDSPMAIDATDVFKTRISDQNITSRLHTIEGKHIFKPQNLHLCKTTQQSREINRMKGKAIIIASSGMITGGRILHHLAQRLPHPEHTILFSGFQVPGTRGKSIVERSKHVKIHGHKVPVNAHIEQMAGFSAHADYNEILAYLMGFNKPPKMTFIVHGEPEASTSLSKKIRSKLGWETVVPEFGDSFDLDL